MTISREFRVKGDESLLSFQQQCKGKKKKPLTMPPRPTSLSETPSWTNPEITSCSAEPPSLWLAELLPCSSSVIELKKTTCVLKTASSAQIRYKGLTLGHLHPSYRSTGCWSQCWWYYSPRKWSLHPLRGGALITQVPMQPDNLRFISFTLPQIQKSHQLYS